MRGCPPRMCPKIFKGFHSYITVVLIYLYMCLYIYIYILDICIYNISIYIYIVGTLFKPSLETICFVFFRGSEPQFSSYHRRQLQKCAVDVSDAPAEEHRKQMDQRGKSTKWAPTSSKSHLYGYITPWNNRLTGPYFVSRSAYALLRPCFRVSSIGDTHGDFQHSCITCSTSFEATGAFGHANRGEGWFFQEVISHKLGDVFKYVLFSPLLGEMIQFD